MICIFLALLAAFQMPQLDLPALTGNQSQSLLAGLPHADTLAEPIVIRGEEPKFEDAIVRAGGYYRYALDLYQLDKTYYAEMLKDNLDVLAAELEHMGDQAGLKASKRIGEIKTLQQAIDQGLSEDSVLALFVHLDTEIRTLVGEYRPYGIHAYNLGNWVTAMGLRITIYPGCTNHMCENLVLSNINLLIETVEREDSDYWNKVLLTLPKDAVYIDDLIGSLEFLAALPYYPIITNQTLEKLLVKLHVVYKVFNLEFVA